MAVRKGGLGKGLDSLIPNKNSTDKERDTKKKKDNTVNEQLSLELEGNTNSVKNLKDGLNQAKELEQPNQLEVDILKVEPNRNQPRKKFDEDSLVELSDSIKQYGILSPIMVQKREDYYEIIAGERRWRAAKLAGLKKVPVIVRDLSAKEIVEISLIENIQRENLNPIEEAAAYQRLLKEFHLKQDEVAERVSKSRTAVTNTMRLLKLDKRVQQMVVEELLTTGHARAILSLEKYDSQYELAQRVVDEKLSVRETEKEAKRLSSTAKRKASSKEISAQMEVLYHDIEERLKVVLGTKVRINAKNPKSGKLEIDYYSPEELERIMDLLHSVGK